MGRKKGERKEGTVTFVIPNISEEERKARYRIFMNEYVRIARRALIEMDPDMKYVPLDVIEKGLIEKIKRDGQKIKETQKSEPIYIMEGEQE